MKTRVVTVNFDDQGTPLAVYWSEGWTPQDLALLDDIVHRKQDEVTQAGINWTDQQTGAIIRDNKDGG